MKHTQKRIKIFPILLMLIISFLSVSTTKSQVMLRKALDYDGDGKGDIAVWRETDGTFLYVQSSNNVFISRQFGAAGDEPIARDYDGDGKTDLAVVRRDQGYLIWYIWQSSNNGVLGYQYGFDTDHLAPGDYDGDGRFDIAVQRAITGGNLVFYIWQSTMGQTSIQLGAFETDLYVPGDYDGDGKTDVAIARWLFGGMVSYEWYIRKSSDGSVYQVNFGAFNLGDMPVQGDYDGDGKTDIAVWRDTDKTFHILQSGSGLTSRQWGATGDLPVASYDTH